MAKLKGEQWFTEAMAANDATATADVSEPVKSPANDVSQMYKMFAGPRFTSKQRKVQPAGATFDVESDSTFEIVPERKKKK